MTLGRLRGCAAEGCRASWCSGRLELCVSGAALLRGCAWCCCRVGDAGAAFLGAVGAAFATCSKRWRAASCRNGVPRRCAGSGCHTAGRERAGALLITVRPLTTVRLTVTLLIWLFTTVTWL